ncbi:hypothetical protein D3C87_1679700 [compost metagenome]
MRRGITPVRTIPVTKIHQLAACFPGDTPVGNLMQTAGIKTVRENNPVVRCVGISRKIDRFVVAFNQTGIKIISETAVKDFNQLFIIMCTVH